MTGSDLCASAKPWDQQLKTVSVIYEEFYIQVTKDINVDMMRHDDMARNVRATMRGSLAACLCPS